jgi:hypothetical protein
MGVGIEVNTDKYFSIRRDHFTININVGYHDYLFKQNFIPFFMMMHTLGWFPVFDSSNQAKKSDLK